MSVKESVLSALELKKGSCISGAELASEIGVSRNAIWKAIKDLQEKGYPIEAKTNKGYCLLDKSDLLSWQSIKKHLSKKYQNLQIEVFDTVGSTNDLAKQYANQGYPENTIIVSEHQSKGKGRMGRSFFSPSQSGVYISFLLRPKFSIENSLYLTVAAAVAAAQAIDEISGEKSQIKWVNDLYLHGKKVCGILTEASVNMENGLLDYVVTGVGFNVFEPKEGFPEEIRSIAGSILGKKDKDGSFEARSILIAKMIEKFLDFSKHIDDKSYMQEYKNRSCLIGKNIYTLTDPPMYGIAKDIDDDGHLVFQKEDGSILVLSSGEVRVRLTEN